MSENNAAERKTYRLYDYYEGKEKLGEYDTMCEVCSSCRERHQDTDGEWLPVLYKLNDDNNYELVKDEWHY